MKKISVTISGCTISHQQAQEIGQLLAGGSNPDTFVVSRYNRLTNASSPCCLKEKIGEKPGWEVYGENHGGQIKIDVNDGDYIFIFS